MFAKFELSFGNTITLDQKKKVSFNAICFHFSWYNKMFQTVMLKCKYVL